MNEKKCVSIRVSGAREKRTKIESVALGCLPGINVMIGAIIFITFVSKLRLTF